MATVRLARVVPYPDERHIHRFAVLLVDDTGQRGLALWVMGLTHDMVEVLLRYRADGGGGGGPAPDMRLTGRLLSATGTRLASVDVDEVGPELTAARIRLTGPAGPAEVTAHLGEALTLALEQGAPIRVADAVLASLGQPLGSGDGDSNSDGDGPLGRLLARPRPAPAALPAQQRQRSPRNLAFADGAGGLDGWELRGSFLRDATAAHWDDYSCRATGQGSAILAAAVPAPFGFADVRQAILAADYRNSTVRFRGEVRAGGTAEQAGLYLRAVTARSARDAVDLRVLAPSGPAADGEWAPSEVSAHIPHEAEYVLFGLTLTGPGQIELRAPELTYSPAAATEDAGD